MNEMQSFYGGLRRQDGVETSPTVGRPVAARFTDGAWYRGVVKASARADITVHFVDYGNTASLDGQLVKRLKEEHCRLPCRAFRCQFGGVRPVGGQWKVLPEKELSKYFEAEMQVTCLSSEGSLSSVEVTLASGGPRVSDQLVANGLAERPAAARAVQQSNIGPFPALERPFAAGERVAVFVAYVVATDRLFVQLSENTAEIEQMAADIEASTTGCQIPCPDVAAGEICLAPFEDVYYRGVITGVEGQLATVYFVDYGNTERMPSDQLLECPVPLVDLPAQAVLCSVTGLPARCAQELTARVDQMELTALVDRVLPSSLSVTLLDGDVNINLELGARPDAPAAARTPSPTKQASPASPAKQSPATTAPSAAAAAPFERVTVSYAVSPHEFYVQDAADPAAQQLDDVMAQLDAEYSQLAADERVLAEVQPGDLVAAPFSEDGAFYRARVLTVDAAGDTCHLQFIDYGNCETAVWPDAAVDAFSALVGIGGADEKTLKLELVRPGDPALVNLYDGQQDVAFAMVGAGFGTVPAPPAAGEQAQPSDEQSSVSAGLAPVWDIAAEQAVFVSHVTSPLEFYVQPADTAPLDELMERLAAEFGSAAPPPAAAPGQLVAAPFSEDGAPYRARLLAVRGDRADVLFVDYGNGEAVATAELRELDSALAALPAQARPCQLDVEACADGAAQRLRELTEQQEEPATLYLLAAGAVSRVRLTLAVGDAAEVLALSALDELMDLLSELYEGREPAAPPLAAPCVEEEEPVVAAGEEAAVKREERRLEQHAEREGGDENGGEPKTVYQEADQQTGASDDDDHHEPEESEEPVDQELQKTRDSSDQESETSNDDSKQEGRGSSNGDEESGESKASAYQQPQESAEPDGSDETRSGATSGRTSSAGEESGQPEGAPLDDKLERRGDEDDLEKSDDSDQDAQQWEDAADQKPHASTGDRRQ
ncbi:tudor domain-containing protein 1-like [Pollicipes pollicipes]|uniref:tudor domain-containing protein 1-like n=1 Tax=Pollicipes pollicipes TaxID=41117 RepID=UPI001884B384|nr:tudor domain-containing protein 1-like [Pollicipes pollicipes]